MEYRYKPEDIPISPTSKRTRVAWRPIVPVILLRNNKFVAYEALIDSGADYCIFRSDIAEILGVQVSKGKSRKIQGINGNTITGYIHQVEIKLAGTSSFTCPVVFSSQIPEQSIGVLGQEGFFGRFLIEFDRSRKIVTIK